MVSTEGLEQAAWSPCIWKAILVGLCTNKMAVHLELRHEGSVEETKGKERLAVKLSSFVTLLPFWGETMERHSRPSAHLLSKVLWPLFNLSDGHQTFGKRSGNSSGHGVFERSVVGRWSDQCGIYLRPKQNYHTYIPMFRFLTVVIAYCLRLTMQYERNPLSSLSPITAGWSTKMLAHYKKEEFLFTFINVSNIFSKIVVLNLPPTLVGVKIDYSFSWQRHCFGAM